MRYTQFLASLKDIQFKTDEVLSSYTTFRIGGKADLLCEVRQEEDLLKIVHFAQEYEIPYKILGAGSNVLVLDKGYRGLVIINKISGYELLPALPGQEGSKQRLRLSSGMSLYTLVQQLFKQNIYGFEVFAGIPATVGGAVYMNVHGDKKLFSDFFLSARLLSENKVVERDKAYFDFSYDYSILHKTREIVLSCDVMLEKGDTTQAKKAYKELMIRKKSQPQRSAGCIFQNLSPQQQEALSLPSPSIGYIIDKVLGLKGKEQGGARISNGHAAFIENYAQASASDVLKLIDYVREEMKRESDIDLKTEIEIIGE